jgi:hypothetical protein
MFGCQAADEPALDTAMIAPAAGAELSPQVAAEPETTPSDSSPTPTMQPAVVAQFSPPFPDRIEMFEPPKRAESTVRRDEGQGAAVELKGFITVDKPRVVLSIDGVIAPVAEGDEKYGVEVISIQPPAVVLQRGRSRWTATLE